jgi:hypothetical protein
VVYFVQRYTPKEGQSMATTKPRVTIMFEPDQYEVLTRLAAIQGSSVGALVRELVETFTPVLGRLTGFLEAAAAAEASVKQNMARVAADQEELLGPVWESVMGQWEVAMRQLEAVAGPEGPPTTNRGVTIPSLPDQTKPDKGKRR